MDGDLDHTHRDVVQSIKVWERLGVCLVFNQLFGTSVKKTNVLHGTIMSRRSGDTEGVMLTGSARRTSSPLSSKINRSTP